MKRVDSSFCTEAEGRCRRKPLFIISPTRVSIPAKILLLPDDLGHFHIYRHLRETSSVLQFSVNKFFSHADNLILFLFHSKCKFVLFTLCPFSLLTSRNPFHNDYFQEVKSFKSSGIILDSKFSWKSHTQYWRDRAVSVCDILRWVMSPPTPHFDNFEFRWYESFVHRLCTHLFHVITDSRKGAVDNVAPILKIDYKTYFNRSNIIRARLCIQFRRLRTPF